MVAIAPTGRRRDRWLARLRELRGCDSGLAFIEFAYILPWLMVLGVGGVEIAHMATAKMKIAQIALSVADNASRLGQTDNSGITPTISETLVDAILDGAMRDGESIDLAENGRIILSSLEWDDIEELPYIHWQRCRGDMEIQSSYGDENENNGLGAEPLGEIGYGTQKFMPANDRTIMLVEVYYEHQGLLGEYFLQGETTFREEAGLLVRDDRNLGPGLTGDSDLSLCQVDEDE